MFKKKILIDLDGVLNNYVEFDKNKIPEIKKGSREFLQELSKDAELYLFTTRNLLSASKWLIENNLDIFFTDITNIKLPAFVYIDDRAIKFNGDFNETLKEIKNFKTYWK